MLRIDIHRWFAMVLGIGWNFPEILSDMGTGLEISEWLPLQKKNVKNLKCSELDET